MSTPRPHTWDLSKHCCALCGEKMFSLSVNRDCGVAAPLEPLDIETFKFNGATSRQLGYLHRTRRDGTSGNLGKLLRNFAAAYAAAVSKNLQQFNTKIERERDAAVVTLRAMCGDNWQMMGRNFAESLEKIEARESRILELEKEIAALELRRKEDADWINKTSQDEAKSFASRCLGMMAYSAGMLLRGEIAALRETNEKK